MVIWIKCIKEFLKIVFFIFIVGEYKIECMVMKIMMFLYVIFMIFGFKYFCYWG